jgi:nitrate reductase NapD
VTCDRRNFLRGAWRPRDHDAETARVLVQVRPERLDTAERAVSALGGITVHSRDTRGRLVLVVDSAAIGPALGALARLPDVLSTNLVHTVARLPET